MGESVEEAKASEGVPKADEPPSRSAWVRYRQRLGRTITRLRGRDVTERNERLMYVQVAFQAIASGGAMAFISVFLVRLGAPNWLVGLYTSLPALLTTLAVLPAGAFVQRRRNLGKTMGVARVMFRSGVGSLALLPLLPGLIAPYLLVAIRSLMAVPLSVMKVSFPAIIGKATTKRRRAQVLSTRMAINRLMMAAVGFLAGQWLSAVAFPFGYQVLFGTAVLVGIISFFLYSRLELPETTDEEVEHGEGTGLRTILPLAWRNSTFRNFMIASFVFRMGVGLPRALFPIYRVRTLGSTDAWLGIIMTVQRFVQMGAFLLLGRALKKPKYRRWLVLSAVGVAFFPVTTALATTPEMLLIPAAIIGLFGAGMNIFMNETLIAASPEDQRPMFASVNAFVQQATLFVAPILGTLLADVITLRWALLIAGGVRLLGALAFWVLRVGPRCRAARCRAARC